MGVGIVFEKLEAYQAAVEFADKVLLLTGKIGKESDVVSYFLKTAAVSIPLSLAEGCGRIRDEERRRFFVSARGSCFKCLPLLALLRRSGIIGALTYAALKAEAESISTILTPV